MRVNGHLKGCLLQVYIPVVRCPARLQMKAQQNTQNFCPGNGVVLEGRQTCEEASRVEVIPFQGDASGAHLLVKGQRLGSAGVLHFTAQRYRSTMQVAMGFLCTLHWHLEKGLYIHSFSCLSESCIALESPPLPPRPPSPHHHTLQK